LKICHLATMITSSELTRESFAALFWLSGEKPVLAFYKYVWWHCKQLWLDQSNPIRQSVCGQWSKGLQF
jgi:hypothetical protein